MTPQEVFDALVAQGGPSLTAGLCAYRGEEGRKCAIGMLIPDELYHEGLEGRSFCSIDKEVREAVVQNLDYSGEGKERLLRRMKAAHDMAFLSKGSKGPLEVSYCWEESLKRLWREYRCDEK